MQKSPGKRIFNSISSLVVHIFPYKNILIVTMVDTRAIHAQYMGKTTIRAKNASCISPFRPVASCARALNPSAGSIALVFACGDR